LKKNGHDLKIHGYFAATNFTGSKIQQ
jgi:hypothetical protein